MYNETIRDLLSPGAALELREERSLGVTVAGLSWHSARSAGEVMALLTGGNALRVTEPTRCNAVSSRSHAVLQVLLRRPSVFSHVQKLSLIDLAGSERSLATELRSARSAEGASINKSLLALSSCIHALTEGKRHIPFRNSRLTQLLKDSLGGGCRTAMIAAVSPAAVQSGESANTLHWADRAKEIRTAAQAPAQAAPEPAAAPCESVDALKAECASLREQLSAAALPSRSTRRRVGQHPLSLSAPSLSLGGLGSPGDREALRAALAAAEAEAAALRAALAAARADAQAARSECEAARQQAAAAAAILQPIASPLAPLGDASNGAVAPESIPRSGSGVKDAVRNFEMLLSPPAASTRSHGPIAPSPGRLLNSLLFQKFAEEMKLPGRGTAVAKGAGAGLPPRASVLPRA